MSVFHFCAEDDLRDQVVLPNVHGPRFSRLKLADAAPFVFILPFFRLCETNRYIWLMQDIWFGLVLNLSQSPAIAIEERCLGVNADNEPGVPGRIVNPHELTVGEFCKAKNAHPASEFETCRKRGLHTRRNQIVAVKRIVELRGAAEAKLQVLKNVNLFRWEVLVQRRRCVGTVTPKGLGCDYMALPPNAILARQR